MTWAQGVAVVTGLSALIGAIKTLATETSGAEIAPGRILYFIGATALVLYLSVGIGAIFGGGVVAALTSALKVDDSDVAEKITVGVAVLLTVVMAVALIANGAFYDYVGTDTVGRVFIALIGLAALALPVWLKVRESS